MTATFRSLTAIATLLVFTGVTTTAIADHHRKGPRGGDRAAMMLEKFDTDGDGALSSAEMEAMAQDNFSRRDITGDGALTLDELEEGALALAGERARRMVQSDRAKQRRVQMFTRLDANGDGTVTQAEFQAHHAERFASRDSNGDGLVTRDEMKRQGHRGPKGPDEDGPDLDD